MPTIYNKVELDGTTLLDLSQDTASSASHIRQGYTAHLNDGTQVTGSYSGGTPTIQSLTVNPSTTQQTFNASGVDGYKPVTVSAVSQTNLTADNIKSGTTVTISNGSSDLWSVTGTYSGGGGASNVVTGTFTGTTTGAAMTVDIQNSGNKRPIAFFIYPSAGMYNPNGTFYTTKQRYAILSFFAVRNVLPIPTDDDAGSTVVRYKNSSTNATTYTQSGGTGNLPFSTSAPTDTTASTVAKVSINANGTKLKVFIASGSYGFMANVEYTYYIIFES